MLSLSANKQVHSLALWFPSKTVLAASTSDLPITGESAYSYDLTTDTVLYDKNSTKRMPMASLTKIMTAIIAMENETKDDIYTVHASDIVGEDSVGLTAGEKLSLEELLYGLILHSGNDAAEVFANNFTGGRNAFISAMNQRVLSMGLKNTHFSNPTGLQGDGVQYTTAQDLVVMSRYALMNFPILSSTASQFSVTIPATSLHKEYYIENETNLISSYPGVKGLKTGYTPEAGLCLVTYLEYGNHKIIAVLLNSANRRDEMKQLLDYSLQKLGVKPPKHD